MVQGHAPDFLLLTWTPRPSPVFGMNRDNAPSKGPTAENGVLNASHGFTVRRPWQLEDRQITHLICVRLKHLQYDFLGGCFGPPSCCFLLYKSPKHPLRNHLESVLSGHRLDESSSGRLLARA